MAKMKRPDALAGANGAVENNDTNSVALTTYLGTCPVCALRSGTKTAIVKAAAAGFIPGWWATWTINVWGLRDE